MAHANNTRTGVESGDNTYQYDEAGYYSFLSTGGPYPGSNASANGDYAAVLRAIEFMASDPPEPFMIFLPGARARILVDV